MDPSASLQYWRRIDPRFYQIGALSFLLAYGMTRLGFDISAGRAALILGSALAAQWAGTRLWRLPAFDPKSALISGLSLCLLLRTNSWLLAATAAILAIGGKFLLRWNGKHIFNPTNFALVALLIFAGDKIWVSPAQWGATAFFGFFIACLGGLCYPPAQR